jgi:hypothetical protein
MPGEAAQVVEAGARTSARFSSTWRHFAMNSAGVIPLNCSRASSGERRLSDARCTRAALLPRQRPAPKCSQLPKAGVAPSPGPRVIILPGDHSTFAPDSARVRFNFTAVQKEPILNRHGMAVLDTGSNPQRESCRSGRGRFPEKSRPRSV